jgi:uncharacterized protein
MERPRKLSEAQYISLETYRKSGKPVLTTVWVVEDAGTYYVRTGAKSGKVKRIRRNPHVRMVPTNLRGKAIGEWEEGVARFVDVEQSGRIKELFRKKYGLQIRLLGLLARIMRSSQLNPVYLGIESTAR